MGTTETSSGIEATVMAIREEVMKYFKGSCVQRLTRAENIALIDLPREGNYAYQRQQHERERPKLLLLGGIPVMTLRKAPDNVVLHSAALNRSPQLREVHVKLLEFFNDYLPAVERRENNAIVLYK